MHKIRLNASPLWATKRPEEGLPISPVWSLELTLATGLGDLTVILLCEAAISNCLAELVSPQSSVPCILILLCQGGRAFIARPPTWSALLG